MNIASFSRPLCGLASDNASTPAINRWAIFGRPLTRTKTARFSCKASAATTLYARHPFVRYSERMNPIKIVLLSLCCIAVLSCAQQSKTPSVSSNVATPPVSSTPPPAPSPAEGVASPEAGDTSAEEFEGSAGIVEKKRPNLKPAILKEVRTASHGNFDRVVFEFEGNAVPGYHIEYVEKPVRDCGQGDVISISGDGLLLVRLLPAQAHSESGAATIKARQLAPGLPIVKEMKIICDFEADMQWVLGVASPNRYRVLELSNPSRLVVDIRH
jgi:hypothetical protein